MTMETNKIERKGEWVCGYLGKSFAPAYTSEELRELRIMEAMLMEFMDMVDTMRNKKSLKEELLKNLAQIRAARKGVRIYDVVKDMHGMLWKVIRIIPAAGDEPDLICKNLEKDLETALCIKDVEVVND